MVCVPVLTDGTLKRKTQLLFLYPFFCFFGYGTDAVHVRRRLEPVHNSGEQPCHLLWPAGRFVVFKVIAHSAEGAAECRTRNRQKDETF